jgi:hypothetical protein
MVGRLVQRVRGTRARAADDDFSLGEPTLRPYAATRWVLARVADTDAARVRRAHYAQLAARLGERVPPDFLPLPPGASPLALPIVSADKPQLIARLAALGIRALTLWTRPHPALRVACFPHAARLRAALVGLPVHQSCAPATSSA